MDLPAPIKAFFDASNETDVAAPIQAFAPKAVIVDEGQSHVGREAIEAWWLEAKAKYQHTAEPLGVREENGLTKVRARVTGQFPGSPLMLSFVFRLAGDLISGLEISA